MKFWHDALQIRCSTDFFSTNFFYLSTLNLVKNFFMHELGFYYQYLRIGFELYGNAKKWIRVPCMWHSTLRSRYELQQSKRCSADVFLRLCRPLSLSVRLPRVAALYQRTGFDLWVKHQRVSEGELRGECIEKRSVWSNFLNFRNKFAEYNLRYSNYRA